MGWVREGEEVWINGEDPKKGFIEHGKSWISASCSVGLKARIVQDVCASFRILGL